MLGVSGIHDIVSGLIAGDRMGEELAIALLHERVSLDAEVYGRLNRTFAFDHERVFTFYGTDARVDRAEDHTLYELYKNLPDAALYAVRDDMLFQADTKRILAGGLQEVGEYHTHPITHDLARRLRKVMSSRYERGPRRISGAHYFPSAGDIGSWILSDPRKGYLFIGCKSNPAQKLQVRAFIPIATIERQGDGKPGDAASAHPVKGVSAIRPVSDYSRVHEQAAIDEKEFDRYAARLRGMAVHATVWDKEEDKIFRDLFIEIPIDILSPPKQEQLALGLKIPPRKRAPADGQDLFDEDVA